jgi:Protein of unknown function (DUF2530)
MARSRRESQREVPPPLEGSDRFITLAITVAWAVALVVVVLVRHQLPKSGHLWIWTCVTGFGLGLFGLVYVPYLKRGRAKAAARRSAAAASGTGES